MAQWPMDMLTVESGSKRKLRCHPKKIVKREDVLYKNGAQVVSESAISSSVPLHQEFNVETKLQGHRYFYCRGEEQYHLFSRRENVDGEFTDAGVKFPYLRLGKDEQFPELAPMTCLDGELIWPGHPDSAIPTALTDCPDQLKYVPFAMPFLRGVDLRDPGHNNYTRVRRYINSHIMPVVTLEAVFTASNRKALAAELTSFLNKAKLEKVEGFVLKTHHYSGWFKLKGILEADVFVISFVSSDSDTRNGLITSVEVGAYDGDKIVHMGRVSGFDFEEQTQMSMAYNRHGLTNRNPYYRRALRVLFQEMASRGKMKHGFFDCWRNDKDAEACSMEQFA